MFSKQLSTWSEEQLEKKTFFTVFYFFSYSEWLFLEFLAEILPQSCQNRILRFREENLGTVVWKTFSFVYFSDLKRKNFCNLTEVIGIVAITIFDVSEKKIWGKIVSVENFVSVFFLSIFDLIFLHFWQ